DYGDHLAGRDLQVQAGDDGAFAIGEREILCLEGHAVSFVERVVISSQSRKGAPARQVITPTGRLLSGSASAARKSASTTITAPTRAADRIEGRPPSRRRAMGPDRNATKAIGPRTAVAAAVRTTTRAMARVLVASGESPSP